MAGEEDFRSVDQDRRLDSLDQRLDRLETRESERTGRGRANAPTDDRMASRVLADLIGGIAGGALFGWLVDRLFDTWPWGFMIFLFLGIVVAFRNIFRIANSAGKPPAAGDQDKTG